MSHLFSGRCKQFFCHAFDKAGVKEMVGKIDNFGRLVVQPIKSEEGIISRHRIHPGVRFIVVMNSLEMLFGMLKNNTTLGADLTLKINTGV